MAEWGCGGVGLWSVGGEKRRAAVCFCMRVFLGEQQAVEVWVEVLKDLDRITSWMEGLNEAFEAFL